MEQAVLNPAKYLITDLSIDTRFADQYHDGTADVTFRLPDNYKNIMRLSSTLDENRTPKQTTVISGSRYIDTKVIGAGRIAYIGSELAPVVMEIKDPFNNPAFIAVQHYSDAGTVLNGEIGSFSLALNLSHNILNGTARITTKSPLKI